jgi:hypothetical protein
VPTASTCEIGDRRIFGESAPVSDKAHDLFGVHHWPDETGRAAYLAGLHAARAFIFETTGEVTKSHRRAQNEFRRLVKDDPRVDMELRAFLGRTFNLKKRPAPARRYPPSARKRRSRLRSVLSIA